MIERSAALALAISCSACGPSQTELAQRQENTALAAELKEVRQHVEDLKFRVQLAESRNKVLIDLVQGLSIDPEHYSAKLESVTSADASLQSLDRDIEALVANVRHSRADVEALRSQRQALQAELAQARSAIEAARAAQQEGSARASTLRQILSPLADLVQGGRINVAVAFGQFSIQVPESALFTRAEPTLGEDGKALLDRIAAGLLTARDRAFRVLGPSVAEAVRGQRPRELAVARTLAVVDRLVAAGVVAESSVGHARQATSDRYFELALIPKAEELPALPSRDQLLQEAQ